LLAASLLAAIRQAVRNRQLPAASRFLRRLRFALSSFWKRIQAACCERASSASRCARCFLSRSDRKRFGKDPRYRLRHAGLVIRCRFSCGIARDSKSLARYSLLDRNRHRRHSFDRPPSGAISPRSILSLAAARSKSLTDLQTFCRLRCGLSRESWRRFPPRRDCRSIQSCDRWPSRGGRLKIACSQACCRVSRNPYFPSKAILHRSRYSRLSQSGR